VLVGAEATGMSRNGDGRWHVPREGARQGRDLPGAHRHRGDGVETMVGRWAGLDTAFLRATWSHAHSTCSKGSIFNPDAI